MELTVCGKPELPAVLLLPPAEMSGAELRDRLEGLDGQYRLIFPAAPLSAEELKKLQAEADAAKPNADENAASEAGAAIGVDPNAPAAGTGADPNATELEADDENGNGNADDETDDESTEVDPLAPTISVRTSEKAEEDEDAEEAAEKPFELGPRVLDDETLEKNDQEGDDFFSGDLFDDVPVDESAPKKADAPKTPSKK